LERSMYGSMQILHNDKRVESTVYSGEVNARVCSVAYVHQVQFELHNQSASNNIAEVLILHEGVQYLVGLVGRMKDQKKNLPTHVTVLSDSEWGLGMVTHAYKPKPETREKLGEELDKIDAAVEYLKKQGVAVNFQPVDNLWVKSVLGH
jgi:hypothetical protein